MNSPDLMPAAVSSQSNALQAAHEGVPHSTHISESSCATNSSTPHSLTSERASAHETSLKASYEIHDLQEEIAIMIEKRSNLLQEVAAAQQKADWQATCLLGFGSVVQQCHRLVSDTQQGYNGKACVPPILDDARPSDALPDTDAPLQLLGG